MANLPVIDFLLAGLKLPSGDPLALGKIETYAAGTSTPKATYTDKDGSTPEQNPIILDAYGVKQVYAQGYYKIVVKSADSATLYTFDNVFFGNNLDFASQQATNVANATARTSALNYGQMQDLSVTYVATVAGTANAITLTPAIPITTYVAGHIFAFLAANTNTTAVTIQVSGIASPKNLIKRIGGVSTSLLPGDLIAGEIVLAMYDGTQYQWLNYLPTRSCELITATGAALATGTNAAAAIGRANSVVNKIFAHAGIVTDMSLDFDTIATVSGGSVTLRLYKNGIDSAQSIVITTGNNKQSNLSTPVTFAAGDTLSLYIETSSYTRGGGSGNYVASAWGRLRA